MHVMFMWPPVGNYPWPKLPSWKKKKKKKSNQKSLFIPLIFHHHRQQQLTATYTLFTMGKAKKTRKFATMKRVMSAKDSRLYVHTLCPAFRLRLLTRSQKEEPRWQAETKEGPGARPWGVSRNYNFFHFFRDSNFFFPGHRYLPRSSSSTTRPSSRPTRSLSIPIFSTLASKRRLTLSAAWWTACSPSVFPWLPTVSWPSLRSWAPSSALRCGWPATRASSVWRAAIRVPTRMTALFSVSCSTSATLWRQTMRTWSGGSARCRVFRSWVSARILMWLSGCLRCFRELHKPNISYLSLPRVTPLQ